MCVRKGEGVEYSIERDEENIKFLSPNSNPNGRLHSFSSLSILKKTGLIPSVQQA
jgi:hypothetical protein